MTFFLERFCYILSANVKTTPLHPCGKESLKVSLLSVSSILKCPQPFWLSLHRGFNVEYISQTFQVIVNKTVSGEDRGTKQDKSVSASGTEGKICPIESLLILSR